MSFVTRHIPGIVTQDEIAQDRQDLAEAQGRLAATSQKVKDASVAVDDAAAKLGMDRDTFLRYTKNLSGEISSQNALIDIYKRDGSRANDELDGLAERCAKGLSDTDHGLFMLHMHEPLNGELREKVGDQAYAAIQSYQNKRASIDARLRKSKNDIAAAQKMISRLNEVGQFGGVAQAYRDLCAQKSKDQKEVNSAQAELSNDIASFNARLESEARTEREIGSFFGSVSRWFNDKATQAEGARQ